MLSPRFLVISLGNPKPYHDCLHSAGHYALAAAQRVLAPEQPPLTETRYGWKNCKVSSASPYTFVQSPTLMNVSGHWILAAYRETLERHALQPSELALVLVHDELESPMYAVGIREWETSHRGHNGVKSAKKSLGSQGYPLDRWARITIGIGRPDERTPAVVSGHVLRHMTSQEKRTIDALVGPKVVEALHKLRDEQE
ncbi:peptidyl-tRNA hydrolase [Xylaria longipes]|nr:peptidyl-tRNA hydrolase [Xylaria longipes]